MLPAVTAAAPIAATSVAIWAAGSGIVVALITTAGSLLVGRRSPAAPAPPTPFELAALLADVYADVDELHHRLELAHDDAQLWQDRATDAGWHPVNVP